MSVYQLRIICNVSFSQRFAAFFPHFQPFSFYWSTKHYFSFFPLISTHFCVTNTFVFTLFQAGSTSTFFMSAFHSLCYPLSFFPFRLVPFTFLLLFLIYFLPSSVLIISHNFIFFIISLPYANIDLCLNHVFKTNNFLSIYQFLFSFSSAFPNNPITLFCTILSYSHPLYHTTHPIPCPCTAKPIAGCYVTIVH